MLHQTMFPKPLPPPCSTSKTYLVSQLFLKHFVGFPRFSTIRAEQKYMSSWSSSYHGKHQSRAIVRLRTRTNPLKQGCQRYFCRGHPGLVGSDVNRALPLPSSQTSLPHRVSKPTFPLHVFVRFVILFEYITLLSKRLKLTTLTTTHCNLGSPRPAATSD